MIDSEKAASEELDIRGYAVTWKVAKEYELRHNQSADTRMLPYWERVRLTFLEYGGERIDRKRC